MHFSPGWRGFIVRRLTALGRETANTAKRRFDLELLTVPQGRDHRKGDRRQCRRCDPLRRDGAATLAMWRRQTSSFNMVPRQWLPGNARSCAKDFGLEPDHEPFTFLTLSRSAARARVGDFVRHKHAGCEAAVRRNRPAAACGPALSRFRNRASASSAWAPGFQAEPQKRHCAVAISRGSA
jgi:hypothetical protein